MLVESKSNFIFDAKHFKDKSLSFSKGSNSAWEICHGTSRSVNMKLGPKFYENRQDGNHCLQAALMSVANSLNGPVSWEEINQATRYQYDLYTWTAIGALALAERFPRVKFFSTMDYREFAKRGEEYLREYLKDSPEWFKLQKEHASNGFNKEQDIAEELIKRENLFEQQKVTQKEIEDLLEKNLLIALVDSGKLFGGVTSSHFVVVYGNDNKNFLFHDPGLPPHPASKITKDQFMRAFQNDIIVVESNIRFGVEIGRNDLCPCDSGKKYKKCHGAIK